MAEIKSSAFLPQAIDNKRIKWQKPIVSLHLTPHVDDFGWVLAPTLSRHSILGTGRTRDQRVSTSAQRQRRRNYRAGPGPGRPPGRKNNRTLQLEEAARAAVAGLPETFDGDAHAFLASVYKNPASPLEIRIMAAGRALRVEKPSLSSVQGCVDVNFDIAERLQAARLRATQARKNGGLLLEGGAIDVTPQASGGALR